MKTKHYQYFTDNNLTDEELHDYIEHEAKTDPLAKQIIDHINTTNWVPLNLICDWFGIELEHGEMYAQEIAEEHPEDVLRVSLGSLN